MSGMSHLSPEVRKKIRCAIKAKLMELGAYVDEELPDYIMVMVLNKKSKETLKHDLQLFLNKNTDNFVDWLFNVLQKLEEVVSEGTKEVKERPKRLKSKVVAAAAPPLNDDSEGEYDPEKILKKSLLSSTIKVPSRPSGMIQANKQLVLKAVAEADQSIKKRKAQERLKDSEDLRERLTKRRMEKNESEKRSVRRLMDPSEDEDLDQMREQVLQSLQQKKKKMSIVQESSRSNSPIFIKDQEPPNKETKTKFIVTLEGINSLNYFKQNEPKKSSSSSATLPLEKTTSLRVKKRPEAKVAPMQPLKSPDKPKRKRITPPVASIPQIALPVASIITPQCKYWPNCSRGAYCYYKHPEKLPPMDPAVLKSKYSWTAASLPP